jgi:hypothetical protein
MHQAANGAELGEGRNNGSGAIVSAPISPVEHMQPGINLIEAALAREASPSDRHQADVIVLDDVTPQFIVASCALNACNTSLGTGCSSRLDARASGHHSIPPRPIEAARCRAAQSFGIAKKRPQSKGRSARRWASPHCEVGAIDPPGRFLKRRQVASWPCEEPRGFFLFLPFRNWMSISVPLTRTSSQRR